MQEQVFINCVPEDLPFAHGIEKRLELAGISFYVPPASLSPLNQKQMVEKVKSIAEAHGCMVCILSNKALSDSLFLSNIQLMCESAPYSRVLVKYEVDDLGSEQKIRLFDSQATLVKRTERASEDISAIIKRINHVIHPSTKNVFQFLSQNISRKWLSGLFIAFAVLGLGGGLLSGLPQRTTFPPVPPTPTPLVMYVPFSGQSQDIGIKVDARYVPVFQSVTDPVVEAPFSFKPAYILEQQDFTDPAFEGTYDGRKWNLNHFRLEDVSSMAVTQTHGVLQMAVAPAGDQPVTLALESKYLFNPDQLTYLGYRFRLEDYMGRKQENTVFSSTFSFISGKALTNPNIEIDGSTQKLGNGMNIALGSRWHTLEMVSQKDKLTVSVYLDGKRLWNLSFDDTQLISWERIMFSLDAANTSDWIRIQIDEIVFGSEQPLPEARLPENAPYRFRPDKVDLHEDYNTQAYLPYLVQGGGYVHQSGSVLSFSFPTGKDYLSILLELPGKPISENNYYATRFRFTSPDDNAWANWAGFFIGLTNKAYQSPNGFDLTIGSMRSEYNFQGHYGLNGILNAFGYNQGAQPGIWHTLEMVIKPPAGFSQKYIIYFWVDGYLLGNGTLDDPAPFLDANAPLFTIVQINGGSYRQDVMSGDIDDLIIGSIASDRILE